LVTIAVGFGDGEFDETDEPPPQAATARVTTTAATCIRLRFTDPS
jgi:hypothetical protein